jgi:hypothetical protein
LFCIFTVQLLPLSSHVDITVPSSPSLPEFESGEEAPSQLPPPPRVSTPPLHPAIPREVPFSPESYREVAAFSASIHDKQLSPADEDEQRRGTLLSLCHSFINMAVLRKETYETAVSSLRQLIASTQV